MLAVRALVWTLKGIQEMAKLKKPKFHLTWPPGSELSDDLVEIWIGSLTVEEFHEGLRLGALASKSEKISDAAVESDDQINNLFAKRLVSWNLEGDDGHPLPPTIEIIKGLPNRTVSIMVREWFKAMTAVPPDSSGSSNGSGRSAEQSLGLGT
jgi:hypothetical protein